MSDITTRLEALAELGIFRVGDAVLEKTHLDGTLKWAAATIEYALDIVEEHLRAHPGIFGHTVSRSDGTHETLDNLRVQAGAPLVTDTPSGAGADVAGASEPEVDTSGVTAEVPGEVATGRVGNEEDAAKAAAEVPAEAAPEGAIQS